MRLRVAFATELKGHVTRDAVKARLRVKFDISENDQLYDDYPTRVTDHPNDEAAAHVNVPQRPARRVNAPARFRDFVTD